MPEFTEVIISHPRLRRSFLSPLGYITPLLRERRVPMNHIQRTDTMAVGTRLATDADVYRGCRFPPAAGRESSPMMPSCQDGMWVTSTISSGTRRRAKGNDAATTRGS
jgi:hypothetical protein